MTNIQLFPSHAQESIQQCIDKTYASYNVPSLGGASVDGWSKISDYMRCPYRYWALHGQPTQLIDALIPLGPKPVALELGALFHALLACHYIGSVPGAANAISYPEYPTAFEFIERMRTLGADESILTEAQRLYIAYYNHYGNSHDDGLQPVAIELAAGLEKIHTCRFDMLAYDKAGGLWIVEHKTASRESRDVLESWWLDGEIIGEVYGYELSGLAKQFGLLVGVLVNIVIKTTVPKFRRVEVVIPPDLLARYASDRTYWGQARELNKLAQHWPRKLQGCISRYDTCSLWDHCRDAETTDSGRMMNLLQRSIDENKR